VLDLEPHMEVAQIGIEKIRFQAFMLFTLHEKNRSKQNQIWAAFASNLNVV